MTTAKLVLTFEIHKGDEFLRRQEFTSESVTIGRGAAAMLQVDDENVADLHAVINVGDDGQVQLLDLGSPAGTQVNGAKINNAFLSSGDQIQVGELRISVAITDEAAFADEEATQLAEAPMPTPAAAASDEEEVLDEMTEPGGIPAPIGEDGDEAVEEHTEDVLAFLMRFGTGSGDAGNDPKKGNVLMVAQAWGDIVIDSRHYGKSGGPVTVGTRTGTRWRYLGVPLAWVPDVFGKVAWVFGPTLSEGVTESKDEFYAPPEVIPDEGFKMCEWQGGQYVMNISEKWSGFVDMGEERLTFPELIASGKASSSGAGMYAVTLNDDTRVVADVGDDMVFVAKMVPASKKLVAAITDNLDYPFLGIMSFMTFLGLVLGIYLATAPPPPENEVMEIPDRFVDLLLQQPEPEQPKRDNKPEANPDAGEGAKAKKEEGKVGKKDAKMEKAKGNKVEMQQKQLDKEIAEDAGVLGALRDGGELDGVFGSSNLNSDLTGGIGGLIGAKGTQMGSGGLGSRGSGLGGGGTAEGLGGLGTKGRGSGSSGYGKGGGNFGAKGEGGIGRIGGDPIILGALDKSLIDAVIKRHMNQIRYCYQRELTKNPELGGKVTVKFVIAKDGSVSKADIKSSSLGNSSVESCISGRFMRFQFPEPKGGGIVIVSYPFIFSPG
ncbi:MAG: AgmX/PglI C-terminal domain-containing protein [Alphaproteobacteria bacterium]|nr:AgmX/PglI C-terminal domain-containing protein [Alphaproteobacteria bacterium]